MGATLLTAAIIVRDEAEHLDACLASLRGLVDEIVVVDTGSTDDSVAVARRHGAVVDHVPWRNDFATPRNRSLDLASGEWILYIDADERVRAGDHDAVRSQLTEAADLVALRVRFVSRSNWTPYREYRMWRHCPEIRFRGAIHESIVQGIDRVARRDGLRIDDLDILTIDHLGYDGDQAHKHERNEPMLRAALAGQPDRPYLYDHLAHIYEDRGELERARATWRRAIEVGSARATDHPDDRLNWINLLVHAVAHDDPDGDVPELIGEAQRRYPGNPAVEFASAAHEFATGDPARAARRLEGLIALDLDEIVATGSAYDERIFDEWAWNSLGLCRFALGDDAGAVAAFSRAEAADPDNPAYRTRRRLAEARTAPRSSPSGESLAVTPVRFSSSSPTRCQTDLSVPAYTPSRWPRVSSAPMRSISCSSPAGVTRSAGTRSRRGPTCTPSSRLGGRRGSRGSRPAHHGSPRASASTSGTVRTTRCRCGSGSPRSSPCTT